MLRVMRMLRNNKKGKNVSMCDSFVRIWNFIKFKVLNGKNNKKNKSIIECDKKANIHHE